MVFSCEFYKISKNNFFTLDDFWLGGLCPTQPVLRGKPRQPDINHCIFDS